MREIKLLITEKLKLNVKKRLIKLLKHADEELINTVMVILTNAVSEEEISGEFINLFGDSKDTKKFSTELISLWMKLKTLTLGDLVTETVKNEKKSTGVNETENSTNKLSSDSSPRLKTCEVSSRKRSLSVAECDVEENVSKGPDKEKQRKTVECRYPNCKLQHKNLQSLTNTGILYTRSLHVEEWFESNKCKGFSKKQLDDVSRSKENNSKRTGKSAGEQLEILNESLSELMRNIILLNNMLKK